MPEGFDQTPGTVIWNELNVRDVEAARKFYEEVMGWTSQDMPGLGSTYTVFMNDGTPVAGMMCIDDIEGGDQIPPNWFTYLAVENIKEAIARVNSNGGTVQKEPFLVPNMGTMAIVADAAGAVVALVEPSKEG